MKIITKIVHKFHEIFRYDPDSVVKNKLELSNLRAKVINGKKSDIRNIKKTNRIVEVMIKSGTLEVVVLNNGKK